MRNGKNEECFRISTPIDRTAAPPLIYAVVRLTSLAEAYGLKVASDEAFLVLQGVTMKRPTARQFFLDNYMPQYFSSRTYEEYIWETSKRLGRLKNGPASEISEFYRNHSLDKLRFSNSIEIDYACSTIVETVPETERLFKDCFVAVTPETPINASAHYRERGYSGHIIEIKAGIVNWFVFFLAPFVTLSWFLDGDPTQRDKAYMELLTKQMNDLAYLKCNNSSFRGINKLELPWFPRQEMWREYTYYKMSTYWFIVLHELGHHALKHTTKEWSDLFEASLGDYVDVPKSKAHEREFEADFFAVRSVFSSVISRGDHLEKKVSIEANAFPLGPILALLGLIYLSDRFDVESDSHPSLKKRLGACVAFYLDKFKDYGTQYGLYLTKAYSTALFGQSGSVTQYLEERSDL